MKFVTTMALSFFLITLAASPTLAKKHHNEPSAHAVAMANLAPADEYFGPLKMSILGIGNAMFNIKRRATGGEISADTIVSLNQVRSSIQDWERKYPRDPWLSRTLLRLHETYMLFPDQRAHELAASTTTWLVAKYPHSKEAALLRSRDTAAI